MKLHLLLVLCCGVLVSCLSSVASETKDSVGLDNEDADRSRKEINECIGIYLNNQRKLDYEVTADQNSSLCLTKVVFVANTLRDKFEMKVKEEYSFGNARCAMNEFDTAETLDNILKVLFYHTDDSLFESEKKTHLGGLESKIREDMINIQKKCGHSEYIANFLDSAFPESSKRNPTK